MRELTKSMMSLSWALSMFGMKQMLDLLNPQNAGKTAASFEEVARVAESQLGSLTRSTFQAGDRLQRGMIDMAFGMFGWGDGSRQGGWGGSGEQQGGGWPPSGAPQQSGWGPMPQQDCGCEKP